MTGVRVNACLDKTIGIAVQIKGHRVGSWTALVSLGAAVGSMLWVLLSCLRAFPPALVAGPPACVVIMTAAAIRRGRSGRRLVWHRYAGAGAVILFAATRVLDQSAPAAFDLAAVSTAAGLAIGRLGCHRIGCCFGIAARTGVRYPWWVDSARRLPLALLESIWCAICFGLGVRLLAVADPGMTALVLVSAYVMWRAPAQRLRDPQFRGRVRNRQAANRMSAARRRISASGHDRRLDHREGSDQESGAVAR